MVVFRISVTMMSRLILNLNSYGDRHARRRTLMRPNAAVGLQPSAQFSTDVTGYSSWIARTAREFESEFESEASTGFMDSAGSGSTNALSDDECAPHSNDIEMTDKSRKEDTPRRTGVLSSNSSNGPR